MLGIAHSREQGRGRGSATVAAVGRIQDAQHRLSLEHLEDRWNGRRCRGTPATTPATARANGTRGHRAHQDYPSLQGERASAEDNKTAQSLLHPTFNLID